MFSLAMAIVSLAILTTVGVLWTAAAIIKEITNKDEGSTK